MSHVPNGPNVDGGLATNLCPIVASDETRTVRGCTSASVRRRKRKRTTSGDNAVSFVGSNAETSWGSNRSSFLDELVGTASKVTFFSVVCSDMIE
jgi:hypothetical protein